MNARVLLFALCMGATLTACATGPAELPIASTPSGRPEAVFKGKSPSDVSGLLASACMNAGNVVTQSTPNMVVCQKTLSGGQAVIAQLAIGNSYSTTPTQNVRFNIVPIGPDTRVQAQQWIETQMAFGQTRTMELNGARQFNGVQALLQNAGGVAP